MRVFVAGASGAIGTRLVPKLIERGHEVIGTFRSPASAERVRALGAESIELDLLDPGAVRTAVLEAEPLALEHDGPGIYHVADDEPAPVRDWLPELARILEAKPPQRFPRLLARRFAGEAPVVMATESRGASNAKAKRELGWTLRYPSWREGFRAAYAPAAPAERRKDDRAARAVSA
jgi:nucleoside-diphosphate-sugar epimerase